MCETVGMPDFPEAPVAPAAFMADYLPAAFAEAAALRESVRDLDARLGVLLTGEGGGEWVVTLAAGEIRVAPGSREDTAFSFVQSVEDWRGSLWEGRGGAVGRQTAALFRPSEGLPASGPGAAPGPAALAQMQSLDGMVRVVVAGGPGGDWQVDMKLGPGAIPAEPSAKLTLEHADAVALEQAPEGERTSLLLQYFMAGRIGIEGDVGLVMQMQALQLGAGS